MIRIEESAFPLFHTVGVNPSSGNVESVLPDVLFAPLIDAELRLVQGGGIDSGGLPTLDRTVSVDRTYRK